jgi:hypothetical protein
MFYSWSGLKTPRSFCHNRGEIKAHHSIIKEAEARRDSFKKKRAQTALNTPLQEENKEKSEPKKKIIIPNPVNSTNAAAQPKKKKKKESIDM